MYLFSLPASEYQFLYLISDFLLYRIPQHLSRSFYHYYFCLSPVWILPFLLFPVYCQISDLLLQHPVFYQILPSDHWKFFSVPLFQIQKKSLYLLLLFSQKPYYPFWLPLCQYLLFLSVQHRLPYQMQCSLQRYLQLLLFLPDTLPELFCQPSRYMSLYNLQALTDLPSRILL